MSRYFKGNDIDIEIFDDTGSISIYQYNSGKLMEISMDHLADLTLLYNELGKFLEEELVDATPQYEYDNPWEEMCGC